MDWHSIIPRTSTGGSEDDIIKELKHTQSSNEEGNVVLYEDQEFSPSDLSSLYVDPNKLPEYATTANDDGVVSWYRPLEYTDDPDYFKSTSGCGIVREGALNDAWLLGVFAAITLHPDNLIENLFVSDSLDAFKHHGLYTVRFYKNCQWVHVTTDTRIPYSVELQEDEMYPTHGNTAPGHCLYGSSLLKNEVFIPFLEKAYAKLHGHYQILSETHGGNVSSKILEAFVDCTGGSAHRIDLGEEKRKVDALGTGPASDQALQALWKRLVRYKKRKCIVTAQHKQLSFNSYDLTSTGIVKNRQYVIVHVKEVSINSVVGRSSGSSTPSSSLRFIKLKNVWGRGMWKGDWSNDDSHWEEHVQVENALRNDPVCEFSRAGVDGYFWMVWEDFIETFNEIYVTHVFENDNVYQYCIPGEWVGYCAAGASIPNKNEEEGGTINSKLIERPIERTKWSVLTDAEANWHRNPQYKLTVKEKTTGILLSLLQRDFRLFGGDNYAINVVILQEKAGRSSIVWEYAGQKIYAEAHSYEQIHSTSSNGIEAKSIPERELIKEDLILEPNASYYVIPYTDHPKVEMEFFLRIFASKPVLVEIIKPVYTCLQQGKWRTEDEETGDVLTAGGPLCLQLNHGDENGAWCQNPQYWLRMKRMSSLKKQTELLATRPYATIKIIVRKTSYKSTGSSLGPGRNRLREQSKDKCNLIGITVVRAQTDTQVEQEESNRSINGPSRASLVRAQAKVPKTNFLGELIEKPQWTSGPMSTKKTNAGRRHESKDREEEDETKCEEDQEVNIPFPTPRLVVNPDEWCRISDYSSPLVACMYLRKVPKEWLLEENGGLMIVPTLGTPNAEATFDVQVDADFPLVLDELPKLTTQTLMGEWTEKTAVGCHLHSEWKKNPKTYLYLKGVRPAKVKITVTRSELEWSSKCKRDTVGTMMGFYLFHGMRMNRAADSQNNRGPNSYQTSIVVNGRPWSDTDFVPLHSVSSPPQLVLPPSFNEPYVIMPSTYEPGKVGKFVISVQCDGEFTLTTEDP